MGEMKSAWQIAMEKADKLGKASPDELNRVKYEPEGNRIASLFLQDDKLDLAAEISKHPERDAVKFINKGIEEILLRNISLPHNEEDQRRSTRAMAGLAVIKENKKQLEAIFKLISNLVNQYQMALQQTYTEFKKKAETTVQQAQRGGMRPQQRGQMPLEQQLQLQLQEEWRQIHSELDAQYDKALDEHKQKIREIT
jgi:vacuolar-type H+-ATPase subunit E/Vma4